MSCFVAAHSELYELAAKSRKPGFSQGLPSPKNHAKMAEECVKDDNRYHNSMVTHSKSVVEILR